LGIEQQSGSIKDYLVHVAPAPAFAGFEGLDDRVMRFVEMLGRVLVL
jgi:hypothetical protein